MIRKLPNHLLREKHFEQALAAFSSSTAASGPKQQALEDPGFTRPKP